MCKVFFTLNRKRWNTHTENAKMKHQNDFSYDENYNYTQPGY